jgi:hypothetical protein
MRLAGELQRLLAAPRCRPLTCSGEPCRAPAARGKERYRMHGVAEGRGATKVSATATTSTDTSLRKLLSSDAGFAHSSRKCWPQWKKSPDPKGCLCWECPNGGLRALPAFLCQDEWDLPTKLKGMRRATSEKWDAKYNAAEDALDKACTGSGAADEAQITSISRRA